VRFPGGGGGAPEKKQLGVWGHGGGGWGYNSYTRDFWKKKRVETESFVERKECSK